MSEWVGGRVGGGDEVTNHTSKYLFFSGIEILFSKGIYALFEASLNQAIVHSQTVQAEGQGEECGGMGGRVISGVASSF